MFLGLEWYVWVLILVLLAVMIPLKVRFLKWWTARQKEKQPGPRGKWGDEE